MPCGNPDGRPKGARNRATVAAERLLDGEADALTRKAIDLAKQGDTTALRLCIERILPARKDRPVSFEMPRIKTVADSVKAAAAIASAVADGELTPMEAAELSKVVGCYTHAVETADLSGRLMRLEQAQGNRKRSWLGQRFRSSNHIRLPRRACKTRCE
jgi:hypothetical protein